ncbi:MAG: hypothetical protein HY796_08255 [Elusimicrobia bacterium]|nr:hypothetical protein [Elusimicrobiota bacterium]
MREINAKKNLKILLYALASGIFGLSVSHAADNGGLPGSFLMLPVGARGGAIGSSFAAWDGDAAGIFWNPALLSKTPKPELNLSQTWLFEDTGHSFIGFSYPLKNTLALGTGYIRQASGKFERRINPFDSPVPFSVYNEAFLGALSFKTPLKRFPLFTGVTLKGVRHKVDSGSGSAMGADLGLNLEPYKKFSVSAVMINALKPGVKLVSRKTTYPSALNLTGAYKLPERAGFSTVIGVSLLKYERQAAKPSAGAELVYRKNASLRLGFSENGIAGGFGVRSGNYMLDYAALFHEIAPVHTISLAIKFGITMQELEEYIKKGINRFDRQEAESLARAYAQKADIYYREKNYIQAIKMYETAVLWDPGNGELGLKLERARSDMDRELNVQVIERNALIAVSYYEKDDLVSSREYWQNVLEINPSDARAKDYLSRIEARFTEQEKERFQDERKAAEQKKALDLLTTASNLLKEEKYLFAAQKASQALAMLPENPQALLLVDLAKNGFALSVQKRLARSAQLCDLKLYAEAMTVINSILGDEPGQKETLEIARKCRGTEPKLTPEETKKMEKLYYMAVDLYLKNDFAQASVRLNEIFAINPLNDTARNLEEKIKKAQKTTQ